MEKKYLNFELKNTGEALTIVASDETLDRYNEVVPLDAWDLKNYKKNPVLLVNHDYRVENIVGRAKNIKITDEGLTFTPEFHNITELARNVSEMVKQEQLLSVSVGFLPHAPVKDGDRPSNELLEISFVPVPANPNAMALAVKALDATEEKAVKEWAGLQETEECDHSEFETQIKSFTDELAQMKEGRVLSGKTRTLIENGLSALKQAVTVLDDLLQATDPNTEKGADSLKGREPREEEGKKVKTPSSVLRALQGINRETNDLLRKYK